MSNIIEEMARDKRRQKYAWIIDIDKTGDDATFPKTMGPRDGREDLFAKLQADRRNGDKFRMYDDDGEHYYSGRIIGDFEGFEPLDDYGTPNAGATRIDYLNMETGEWEVL